MKARFFVLILLLISIPAFAVEHGLPENFDVQGHRGARGLKPENTLPAFEVALDLGVTTLELDLHYTADDALVVWHDPAIKTEFCELPEGVDVDIPDDNSLIFGDNPRSIRKLTLEQVQAFRCDKVSPSTFPDQDNEPTELAGDAYHIPTLREVFEFVEAYAQSDEKTEAQRENAAQIRYNLESKRQVNRPSAIDDDFDGKNIGEFEQAIVELVLEFDLLERTTFQSFDHRVVWAIKDAYPDATVAALTSRQRPRLEEYVDKGAAIWSPNYNAITPEDIEAAQALGLRVIPWTINDAETMRQFIEWGVDGIITDQPDILLNLYDD